MAKFKKKLPKHFYCELFMENFYFFKDFSFKEFCDYLKSTMGFVVNAPPSCKGKFYELVNDDGFNCYVLWVDSSSDTSVLVHESCHAATAILSSKGHRLDPENDELFAYYTGLIFRKYNDGEV